ncbi:MAG: GGDEF domain-containing protein [Eubacteriales bacterium]
MNETTGKNNLLGASIALLLAVTVTFAFFFWRDMRVLNSAYADMNSIEFISSSTQRLINLATSDQFDSRVMYVIGEGTHNSLTPSGSDPLSVLEDVNIALMATEVIRSWTEIEEILLAEELNHVTLGLARDSHFMAMTNLSAAINEYTTAMNSKIAQHQGIVLAALAAIGVLLFNYLLRARTELKLSRALAETAQIDTATGLYNRSRCQELFKMTGVSSSKKHPAILVMDLNDLKKTNDSLRHRVGDELIQSFANLLKKAAVVHIVSPFIGRYGGDEFIVYYDNITGEEEITTFLKELEFCAQQFNESENRFQVSYAVGYSFVSMDHEEKLTTRQLFDKADEAMYKNKIAEKLSKDPNYDGNLSRGETTR